MANHHIGAIVALLQRVTDAGKLFVNRRHVRGNVKFNGVDVRFGFGVFGIHVEGGTVTMPFAASFWAKGFGMVTDRWGTAWMVSTPD